MQNTDPKPSSLLSMTDHEVFLITAQDSRGRKSGFIATWVLPASLLPGAPRVLIEVSPLNFTFELIKSSGHFLLHLLAHEQYTLMHTFGLESGRDQDKFADINWSVEPNTQLPLIDGVCGYGECKVWDTWDIGERIILVADMVHHICKPQATPLTKSSAFGQLPTEQVTQLKAKHKQLGEQSKQLFRP